MKLQKDDGRGFLRTFPSIQRLQPRSPHWPLKHRPPPPPPFPSTRQSVGGLAALSTRQTIAFHSKVHKLLLPFANGWFVSGAVCGTMSPDALECVRQTSPEHQPYNLKSFAYTDANNNSHKNNNRGLTAEKQQRRRQNIQVANFPIEFSRLFCLCVWCSSGMENCFLPISRERG